MARLAKRDLIGRVIAALRADGWSVVLLTPPSVHPARLRILRNGAAETIRIYIWNISHGGGARRPREEYRIQITGVTAMAAEPGGKTLLLGWDDELEVFAAFDLAKHAGPVAASPSIQIGRAALEGGARNGLSPYNRGNGEIAFAVRPDYLTVYLAEMTTLHATGAASAEVALLEQLAADPQSVDDDDIDDTVAAPRKRGLFVTWRLLRDRNFRKRVLAAYGHGCAMCELQLGLLDAAHILPVGHPASTDKVRNGVALCALHHRAYDLSLVTFDPAYAILVSAPRLAALAAASLAGGEAGFRGGLRPTLKLPPLTKHRPRPGDIRKANQFRGWP